MQFPLAHLSRRFYEVVTARALSVSEQAEVRHILDEAEHEPFFAQARADQRHAYDTLVRLRKVIDDPIAHRAALLHDVGKAAPYIGPVRRVVATVLDAARLPLMGSLRAYRRHGALGAARLEALGCPALVVDFARRHPDPDPQGNDPALWAALLAADHS